MIDSFSWRDIPGHFDFHDLYVEAVASAPAHAHFAENGVMLGRSACFMAEAIGASRKQIVFDAIDSFAWSFDAILATGPYVTHPRMQIYYTRSLPEFWQVLVDKGSTFEAAKYCLERAGVAAHVNLIRRSGQAQAVNYVDGSLDFVFVDAEHTYNDTVELLRSYLPKVRPGGVLAGHDFTNEFPGVVEAVCDVLGRVEVRGHSFVYRKQI